MSNRAAVIEEMRTYGVSNTVIEAMQIPDPISIDGLRAFRQGLAEAGNGELNPTFPIELRHTAEYAIGTSVIGLYQENRGDQAA